MARTTARSAYRFQDDRGLDRLSTSIKSVFAHFKNLGIRLIDHGDVGTLLVVINDLSIQILE